MAIELVNASPAHPFSFHDLDQDEEVNTSSESSPEIPIAELPSDSTSQIPLNDASTYGGSNALGPLYGEAPLVQCEHCDKPVLASALVEHHLNCDAIRTGGAKEKKDDLAIHTPTDSKKRKALPSSADDLAFEPSSKKKKTGTGLNASANGTPTPVGSQGAGKTTKASGATGAGKGSRQKGPLDLDKHCGVFNEKKGSVCTRSITCKVHSMRDKRQIIRSKPYDQLVLEFRKAVNPNYVEPPKRETKAERKEKERRERLEKRAKDVAEGRVDPNEPWSGDEGEGGADGKGGTKGEGGGKKEGSKKKDKSGTSSKKKKAAGANGASGSGGGKDGTSSGKKGSGGANGASSGTGAGSGANGTNGEGGTNGGNGDDSDANDGDFDSEAEADALIEAVQRARGIYVPPPSSFLIPPSSTAAGPATSPTTSTAPTALPPPSSAIPQTPAASAFPQAMPLPQIPYYPKPLGQPLALPLGASSFFVARNEALRCCADIVRSALGGGGSTSSLGGGASAAGGGGTANGVSAMANSMGFISTSVPGSAGPASGTGW